MVVGFTTINNGYFLYKTLNKYFLSSVVDRTQLEATKIQTFLARIDTKVGFFVQAILAIPKNQRSHAIKVLLSGESASRGLMIIKANKNLDVVAEHFASSEEKIEPKLISKTLENNPHVVSYHPKIPELAWIGKKIFAGDQHGILYSVTIIKIKEIYNLLSLQGDFSQEFYILDHELTDLKLRKNYPQLLRSSLQDKNQMENMDNIEDMLSKDLGAGYLGEMKINGTPKMIAFNRLEGTPLMLVVHQSSAPIKAAIFSFLEEMFQWSVFCLLIAILLAKGVIKGLLQSLHSLYKATISVAQGDFSTRVQVTSKDEIGQLSHSFNTMTDKILTLLEKEKEKVKLDQELATANAVQNTFINCKSYQNAYIQIESFYKPASLCGGDWWGHFHLSHDQELILIGDATGHGVPAALVTAIAFSVAHQYANDCLKNQKLECDPAHMLSALNDILHETLKGNLYMSFVAIVLDPHRHRLRYANAGHPFPLKFNVTSSGKNRVTAMLPHAGKGGILGVEPSVQYTSVETTFVPGDRVLLYTDGVTEVADREGKQWGRRGLTKILEKNLSSETPKLRDEIIKNCRSYHLHGDQFPDDVTFVVIENRETLPEKLPIAG